MFGLNAQQKPRKLTTYGKAGRQQPFAFKSFLEQSPEKRKSQVATGEARDQNPTNLTRRKPDTSWDIPASDEDSSRSAPPIKLKAKSAVQQKSKVACNAIPRPDGGARQASKLKARSLVDEAALKKRKREDLAAIQNVSPARDIFDIPDDDVVMAAPPPVPLPTRGRAKTPSALGATATYSTATSRSRKNTPEPQSLNHTPITARKTIADYDIYDIPDNESDAEMKTKARAAEPLPARKRQKTPARDVRAENKVKTNVKSRATTPQRSHPSQPSAIVNRRRVEVKSPQANVFNGVAKRKITKGASAPASLFKMIREPPSPPSESSDSVASPASPGMSSEMDTEATETPATPLNRASVSPRAAIGSVTPKQKQLWSQLLGDDVSDSPSELPISQLRLSSTIKPTARKAPGLTRSASDVPQSTTNRRRRLIDTLKATAPIAEAEDMDLDNTTIIEDNVVSSNTSSQSSDARPPKLRTEVSFKKTSTKVTYGQGRTYLEEKNEDQLWDMLAAEEPSQSYSTFGSQKHSQVEEDVDMEETSQPRAAHDLRAAGSRRRLHDELSSFIMDIEQRRNSQSIRRSALRDLAEKLLEKEAATCFVESGLDNSFLTAVERDTDNVFLFLEAAVLVLIVDGDPTSSVLDHVFHSQTFNNIFKLLDLNTSLERLLRDRKSNLAKMSQSMMLEFRDQLFAADVWGTIKPRTLTPRVLGLNCVEMVVRKLREHGSSCTLLEEDTVKKVLDIARLELASSSPDMAIVELALSALQVNTVSAPSMRNKIWPPALTESFAQLLPAILSLSEETAVQSMQLALKLAVELTNHNAAACDAIGSPAVINPLLSNANKRYRQLLDHQAGEQYNVAFDFTVLSFGLTINLTEASDKARLAMVEDGGLVLEETIKLFLRGKQQADDAESLEDTQMNIIYGCLSFTLGNLSRNAVLRRKVASQFSSGSLDVVLDAMQEFAAINRLTDTKEFEGEEGHEVSKIFTERLQSVLEEVRALNA